MNREEYRANARLIANRGEATGSAKLTEVAVARIKRQHARKIRLVRQLEDRYSAKGIAKAEGVSTRTIERLLARETWVHVRVPE